MVAHLGSLFPQVRRKLDDILHCCRGCHDLPRALIKPVVVAILEKLECFVIPDVGYDGGTEREAPCKGEGTRAGRRLQACFHREALLRKIQQALETHAVRDIFVLPTTQSVSQTKRLNEIMTHALHEIPHRGLHHLVDLFI